MELFFGILFFVMGTCAGSFVNMLVYRTAKDYGVLKSPSGDGRGKSPKVKNENRSFCDFCGKQLHWYENIPVISWILQNGKSRCCHRQLSLLYPIVELVMGLLFVITVSQLGLTLSLIPGFVLVTMMVFSFVFDLKYMVLPDFSTMIMVIMAGILVFLGRWSVLPLQYLEAAVGAMVFLGVLYLVSRGKAMGFGDVKLAFFMGLLLGLPSVVVAFYVAFISGAIGGVGLMLAHKARRKSLIAFGPFLILGTFIAWWWGRTIWYSIW